MAAAAGVRRPDSLPFPHRRAGTESVPQIKHVVVLMMENHSFDNVLGMVPFRVPGRRKVDGLTRRHGRLANFNPDPAGQRIFAAAAGSPCQLAGLPRQDWNASHQAWAGGANSGFVLASGPVAMRFWDDRDLPFTYSLVEQFPVGNRYFSSALAQTYPNRRFLFCGTASGLVATTSQTFQIPAANGTIFDRLDAHHVNWANYYQQVPSGLIVPGFATVARRPRLRKIDQFYKDAAAGRLPAVSFLDPNYATTSEENPQDIQVGEEFVAKVTKALLHGPGWKHTAFFLTYDEHGGYYDHVPPPRAIPPDNLPPVQPPGQPALTPGGFDRYGFRVPTVVVSPWARADYVSNVVQDHTSITAFIEHKFNLPAMTFRDANAHPMTDYFDFTAPVAPFAEPPRLAAAPGLAHGLGRCHAAGLNPPL
ncbi:MAG TPA: alkaline phosphatase family protein [Solirubrobacteraceae bacterium]|nr:alkaline phosphatase family protein [Solirubrobacteraceae bacterium]